MFIPDSNCIVVEVPARQDGRNSLTDTPRDLLPWADPYIAMLIEKHRSQLERFDHGYSRSVRAEASPPVGDWYSGNRISRRYR